MVVSPAAVVVVSAAAVVVVSAAAVVVVSSAAVVVSSHGLKSPNPALVESSRCSCWNFIHLVPMMPDPSPQGSGVVVVVIPRTLRIVSVIMFLIMSRMRLMARLVTRPPTLSSASPSAFTRLLTSRVSPFMTRATVPASVRLLAWAQPTRRKPRED